MDVKLHIYDISGGLAKELSQSLLGTQLDGIWHTGVVIYGKEYFFGGGIQCVNSFAMQQQIGMPTKVEIIGKTEIPKEIFQEFVESIRSKYTSETYDLFTHNCNNFSDELCEFLIGAGIPNYILNLPNVCANTPFGGMIKSINDNFQASFKF